MCSFKVAAPHGDGESGGSLQAELSVAAEARLQRLGPSSAALGLTKVRLGWARDAAFFFHPRPQVRLQMGQGGLTLKLTLSTLLQIRGPRVDPHLKQQG